MKLLINRGADPNLANNLGETPIFAAETEELADLVAKARGTFLLQYILFIFRIYRS